ncbi:SDR family oxidoreductase [Blastopirellula sp. JC732]|uniref:SDR family oxidoreductase n=1 Tax=Blastopirellula sediminis TaxID=2894196 RepID=A0A9X1SEK9_9BACT|nr:SDR family oxidoreductase [Blastopirellula sediminis]MCC9607894.1 SDR family oxidoreductase [Blastopirellula sediminis]MCC9627313.1 SDR family oxidoreductase [Blastopirellula sediminis]
MKYHLLTGATGLLGRYLIRDLTLADIPLAVVVRGSRFESAAQRIETAMAYWEAELGRALVRPVVLEGDITKPGLGLSDSDQAWVAKNCEAVVHSAASLTFYADEEDGEPWRSNILGTRNVLGLCRDAGIRQLHHVSTAYVCGRRRDVIREDEVDVGQEPSNDYESSKLTAEKEVRAADFLDVLTVHRPSIIVGDALTGFTVSYHGFYTPLRLVHALVTSLPWDLFVQCDLLGALKLDGSERKNLVPVDWVSAAMTEVIRKPELHGKTYHFTNPNPATVADMLGALASMVMALARPDEGSEAAKNISIDDVAANFREQMWVYQSYWSDDPSFDSSNTEQALPYLPCPAVDDAMMDRLVAFALEKNFGWPREASAKIKYPIAQDLAPLVDNAKDLADGSSDRRYVSLQISGSGGGQWHMIVDHGRLVGVGPGLQNGDSPTCYLNSDTFTRLTRGELSWESALQSGRLVTTGHAASSEQLARCFHDLASLTCSDTTNNCAN